MTMYPLSISRDYAPTWTLVDAVRELFQNALDQQTMVPDNVMFHNYTDGVFKIGNKKSVLEARSLLLGTTTKTDEPDTIGQFGEGYKIACLVLCRLGKKVTFYNYGAREVWRPRFVKSRKYKAEILTFFVDKQHVWRSVPDNNLTIEIAGISEDEFFEIGESNLHMQEGYSFLDTEYGNIMLDEDLAGKIFVSGLYVHTQETLKYGYDLKPKHIKLDRDRKMTNLFELQWLSARMWASTNEKSLIRDMIEKGAADVSKIHYHMHDTRIYDTFVEKYGNAVPVTSQEQLDAVPSGRRGVIVNETHYSMLVSDSRYEAPEAMRSLSDRFAIWLDNNGDELSPQAYESLNELIKECAHSGF